MLQLKIMTINTMTMRGRERDMEDYLKENGLPDVVFLQEVRVTQLTIASYHVFFGEPILVRRGSYGGACKKTEIQDINGKSVLDLARSTFVEVKERRSGRTILVTADGVVPAIPITECVSPYERSIMAADEYMQMQRVYRRYLEPGLLCAEKVLLAPRTIEEDEAKLLRQGYNVFDLATGALRFKNKTTRLTVLSCSYAKGITPDLRLREMNLSKKYTL